MPAGEHGASDAADVSVLPICLIRTMQGEITAWPVAMEQRYGFQAKEAVGRHAHELLRTMSWDVRRHEIEAELVQRQRWRGGLVHHRATGQPIMSANRWFLQDDPAAGKVVLEIHSDVVLAGTPAGQQMADILGFLAHELSEPITAGNNYLLASQREAQRSWPDRLRMAQSLEKAKSQIERMHEILDRMRALGEDLRSPRAASLHATLTATMEKATLNITGLRSARQKLAEQLELRDVLLEIARQSHDERTSERIIELAALLPSRSVLS